MNLSTVLIAAGGYVINDYYDVKVDFVNKPQKVVVETVINRRAAMVAHIIITSVAILIGLFLAYRLKIYWLALVQPFTAALLFFYTTTFKKKVLIGNLIVSFLTGLVVWMMVLYEVDLIKLFFSGRLLEVTEAEFYNYSVLLILLLALAFYGVFAFLTSMLREAVKDLEDIKGDLEGSYRTMPIAWGIKRTKVFVMLISMLLGAILLYIIILALATSKPAAIVVYTGFIFLQLIFFMVMLYRARRKSHFHMLSQFLKFLMLVGILTSVVNYFIF